MDWDWSPADTGERESECVRACVCVCARTVCYGVDALFLKYIIFIVQSV